MNPWRHGVRGRDRMGYKTNEGVKELAEHFTGSKLYGSALAHMLKKDDRTSSSLRGFSSGPLHDHLKRVLEFVLENMPNLKAIVCLGNEAYQLVMCLAHYTGNALSVGDCVDIQLFKRHVLLARLYHPSRRRTGWQRVADQVNKRIADG